MDMSEEVIVINCVWCSEPGFSDNHVHEFITRDRYDCNNPEWFQEAYSDLCSCFDCVEEFHRSLDSLLTSSPEDTSSLKASIHLSNVARLSDRLTQLFECAHPRVKVEDEESGFHIVDYQLKTSLETPLLELLSYPRLLLDSSLCDLFVRALELLLSVDPQFEITKKLPGVYLLLVHPSDAVRRWSVGVVLSLGPVDWEDYDDLEEVVHWLLNVVLFDMFSEPQFDIGSAAWDDSEAVTLPSHLYNHRSKKEFWLGLCMLVTSLDATCVRSKLMSSSSGHPEIISNILQTMSVRSDPSVFLPILKCFSILLDRLGSRFWQFTNAVDPKCVCITIFSHYVFKDSVKEMCKKTHEDDRVAEEMSNSQLVFQQISELKAPDDLKSNEQLTTSVIFSWIVPFMNSLLDFGMEYVISDLFTSVGKLLIKKSAADPDKSCSVLYHEAINTLARMVDALYSKQAYSILLTCQNYWLKPLIKSVDVSLQVSVVKLLKNLLSSPTAKSNPLTSTFLSFLKLPLTVPIYKRKVGSKSLSSQISGILSILKALGSGEMHMEECEPSEIEPPCLNPLPPVKREHERLVKGSEQVLKMEENKPSSSKSDTSVLKKAFVKREERPSGSCTSTDELEECECGPSSLRVLSPLSSHLKQMKKNRLSLKHQSNRVVYEERMSSSPSSSQPLQKKIKLATPESELKQKGTAVNLSPSVTPVNARCEVISQNSKTPPLSPDSSFDSDELPSLNTLMSTPTMYSKRKDTTKAIKRTLSPQIAPKILNFGVTNMKGVKMVPNSKAVYKCQKELTIPLERLPTSVSMKGTSFPKTSVTNKVVPTVSIKSEKSAGVTCDDPLLDLSHEEVADFDKFSASSEDEVFPVAKIVKSMDYFSADEQYSDNGLTGEAIIHDLTDDDIKLLDDFSEDEGTHKGTDQDRKAQGKKDLGSPPEKPLLYDDTLSKAKTFRTHSDPPDSQSESAFVLCDLTDPKEESESRETNETLFTAFEAQAKPKSTYPGIPQLNASESKTTTQEAKPLFTMSLSAQNLEGTDEVSDDEELQELYKKKVWQRKQYLKVPPSHNIESRNEKTLEDMYSDVSSDNLSQQAVGSRDQSPKISDISSSSRSELSSASPVKVPKSVRLSPVSVEVDKLNIHELISKRNSKKATEEKEDPSQHLPNTGRKRKHSPESDPPDDPGTLAPSTHLDSKRPKLAELLVNEFLSSRTTHSVSHQRSRNIPELVKPPGLMVSARKYVVYKSYGDPVTDTRVGREVQTTSTSLKTSTSFKLKSTSTQHSFKGRRTSAPTRDWQPEIGSEDSSLPSHSRQSLHKGSSLTGVCHGEPVQRSGRDPANVRQHISKPLDQSKSNPTITPSTASSSGNTKFFPVHAAGPHVTARQTPLGSKSGPTSPKVPHLFTNKLSSSTTGLMSAIPHSPSSPQKSRPPPPRPQKPTISTKPASLKKINDLYATVLSWDPNVFLYPEQDEKCGRICPPCSADSSAHTVPLAFHSYDQYFEVFAPLFFMELWETVFREIDDPKYKPPPCDCTVESITHSGYLHNIRVKIIMPASKAREYAHPNERDLVVIQSHHGDTRRFAIVDQYKHNYHGPNRGECEVLIDLKLCGQFGDFVERSRVSVRVAMSMTNEIRQWIGLINFHISLLTRDLLYPRGKEYFCHPSVTQPNLKVVGTRYNVSQGECIATAVRAMCAQYAQSRILLLQGPPGTGKTCTISGIIREGFHELHKQSVYSRSSSLPGSRGAERRRPHILVCAPSNAAVDEIIRKLIKDGIVAGPDKASADQVKKSEVRALNVVRIGNREKIHRQIIPFSLDELAKKKIKIASEQEEANSRKMDKIRQQLLDMERKIEDARNQVYYVQSNAKKGLPDKMVDVHALEAHIKALEREKSELTRQHKLLRGQCANNKRDQTMIRKRILVDADVVCATLCGSGSSALAECVKNVPQHFDCLIVDEASQCTELDVLVPLRYRASKLILVGDPLQLPATVRSRHAERCGYGQSLFERLYKYFTSQANREDNPVKMLTVQYRMLPEICFFPSKHFYGHQLQTDSSVVESRRVFSNLNCFLMFNVLDGNEVKVDGSIKNTMECQCLLSLLKLLRKNRVQPQSIGVITPYKAQEKHIKYLVRRELTEMSEVDVGTVDGFQGREKDIIVLSCVRANSRSGSVGFLCDRKRLNVALTRAKRALYVLGHHSTLQVNEDWAALIEHAKHCNAVIDVVASDQNAAVACVLKSSTCSRQLKYTKSKTVTISKDRLPSAPTTPIPVTNSRGRLPSAPTAPIPRSESSSLNERQGDPRLRQPTASILRAAVNQDQIAEKPRRATVDSSSLNERQRDLRLTQPTASILRAVVNQDQIAEKPRRATVDSSSLNERQEDPQLWQHTAGNLPTGSSSIVRGLGDPRLAHNRIASNEVSTIDKTEIRSSTSSSESSIPSKKLRVSAFITEQRINSSDSSKSSTLNTRPREVAASVTEMRRHSSSSSESSIITTKPQDPRQRNLPLDHSRPLQASYQLGHPLPNHSEVPPRQIIHSFNRPSDMTLTSNIMKSSRFEGAAKLNRRVAWTAHSNVKTREALNRVAQGLAKKGQNQKPKSSKNSGSSGSKIRERLSKSKKHT